MIGPRGVQVPLLLSLMGLKLPQGTFGQNNLALGRSTLQSSNWRPNSALAPLGVDGVRESCTNTSNSYSWQWWRVDLQAVHKIKSIRIKGHTDCCANRLANIMVEVSMDDPSILTGYPGPTNSPVCVTIQDPVPIPDPVGYVCDDPVTGRYVRVVRTQMSAEPITICEFEVFETNILTEKPNLALFKPASQSSIWEPYKASKALDNNKNSNIFKGTCTHTDDYDPTMLHWWMVDLEDIYMIESVSITNRDSRWSERLKNFYVEISIKAPNTLEGFPGRTSASVCVHVVTQVPHPGSILYPCDRPVLGRYVRVVKQETVIERPLSLCDFEVFEKEDGRWQFRHVMIQGLRDAPRSNTAGTEMLDCARQQSWNRAGKEAMRFFQVDLSTGSCHFIQTIGEANISASTNWILYELE